MQETGGNVGVGGRRVGESRGKMWGERRNVRGVGKAWEEFRRPKGMWGQVEGEWGKVEGKCGEKGSVRVMGRVWGEGECQGNGESGGSKGRVGES